jgi:tetratricopeptide (TPR) repeat protein
MAHRGIAVSIPFLLALIAGDAWANKAVEIRMSRQGFNEQYERDVDEVALASQEKAIAWLVTFLKKYKGTRQEPILLSKLGDLQQQNATILFRLTHRSTKKVDPARFNRAVQATIATLTTLISKYPGFEEIPHAYYSRGKSFEEIGLIEKATHDYLHLVRTFPDSEDTVSAYMSLAEFAIQANDHAKAISHLVQVEKHPESPHYPFALYKLAWAHYNLKETPTALSYAERNIAFYNERLPVAGQAKTGDTTLNSDSALRDNTLQDLALFFFQGYEGKVPRYALQNALPYFKKIENGAPLGRILVRFSKLLRSHGHESDLGSFKDQVISSESERQESLDILLITFEMTIGFDARNRLRRLLFKK